MNMMISSAARSGDMYNLHVAHNMRVMSLHVDSIPGALPQPVKNIRFATCSLKRNCVTGELLYEDTPLFAGAEDLQKLQGRGVFINEHAYDRIGDLTRARFFECLFFLDLQISGTPLLSDKTKTKVTGRSRVAKGLQIESHPIVSMYFDVFQYKSIYT